MKKPQFAVGEFYHIYNRGNNKRPIILKSFDSQRFLQSMVEFNVQGPIGSIYAKSFEKNQLSGSTTKRAELVDFVCYCLNPNHFHFLVRQLVDGGVKELMHKLGTGYTRYFNEKNKFSGALFQGRYKAIHVDSNEYLLYLSAYINLNPDAHQLSGSTTRLVRSSWEEYVNGHYGRNKLCNTKIVLSQFKTRRGYQGFAEEALEVIKEKKEMKKEMEESLRFLLSG